MTKGAWMHENSMDVFIRVNRIQYQDGKRIKVKAEFWNLGYMGEPFSLNESKTIEITEPNRWIWLSAEDLQTKRTKSGHPKLSRAA